MKETIVIHRIENEWSWYATSNKKDEYQNVPIPTPFSAKFWSKEDIIKKLQVLNPNANIR